MCGIAGVLIFGHRQPAAPERIEGMVSALRHRGPDDAGVYCDRGLGIGAARLSIVDLPGGRQPMVDSERGLALVCNGEIYNHLELRRELASDYSFRTRCDTEVVLALYAVHGRPGLERLNGMFAFALWDRNEERLLCARDRAGQKPLYYAEHEGALVFGSEPTALFRYSPELREIEPKAVRRYMVYDYVPTPDTIFKKVKRLPAGHSIVATTSGVVDVRRYWRLSLRDSSRNEDRDQAVGPTDLLAVFDRAVARHSRADVPVGVFLSGGLDSSAVVASLAAQGLASELKTFSVAIPEPAYDETQYAELVARRFATDHQSVPLTAQAFADTALRLAPRIDEPLSDASIVGGALVASVAARHVKVVLGGDGGDELFAGYPSFIGQRIRHLPVLRTVLPRIAGPVASLLGRMRPSEAPYRWDRLLTLFLAAGTHPPEVVAQLWLGAFAPGDRILVDGEPLSSELFDDFRPRARHDDCSSREAIERTLQFYFNRYLQDDILTKIDRATMASSLEQRSPFLDDELIAMAEGLDVSQKVRTVRTKVLFRQAMRGRVPDQILRRQKRGFSMPLSAWFRSELSDFVADRLSPSVIKRQGFFDPERVEALVTEHKAGHRDHRRKLWSLLSFTLWHEHHAHG